MPEAALMSPAAVRKKFGSKTLDRSKLPVGGIEGDVASFEDNRHAQLFVGTRGGKFGSSAGPILLNCDANMIVTDLKTELSATTLLFRANELHHDCILLAPFGAAAPWLQPYIKRFNPLSAIVDSKHLISNCGVIAGALIEKPISTELHWYRREKKITRASLILVSTDPEYEGRRTLNTAYDLLCGDIQELAETFLLSSLHQKNKKVAKILKAAAIDLKTSSETELASVFSGIRANLAFLDLEEMEDSLSSSDFELDDLKHPEKKITLYLSLPTDQLPECHKWISMIYALFFKYMERNPYKPPQNVICLIDEIASLGYCEPILNAVSYIAGSSVRMVCYWQDASQGFAIYKERFNSFLANSGLILAWACSDPKTLSMLEERTGKTPVLSANVQQSGSEALKGDSFGYQMMSLLPADEIRRFFNRDMNLLLCLIPENDPIVLERFNFWDERCPYHHLFKGKFKNYEEWRKEQG